MNGHPLRKEIGWMLENAWSCFRIGVAIYWPRMERKVEARVVRMRWIPPQDPLDSHETGFWMEHEAAKRMEQTGEWRARVFLSTGPAVAA